jgi:hypothetical protein
MMDATISTELGGLRLVEGESLEMATSDEW